MTLKNKEIIDIANIANTSKEEVVKYSQLYKDKPIVIKYGGHAMGAKKLSSSFVDFIIVLSFAFVILSIFVKTH